MRTDYIVEFLKYQVSWDILNALNYGHFLTLNDLREMLRYYVEHVEQKGTEEEITIRSISKATVNRFLRDIRKHLPTVGVVPKHPVQESIVIPHDVLAVELMQKIIDRYHMKADLEKIEREIKDPEVFYKQRKTEKEYERISQERIDKLINKMLEMKRVNARES